MSGYILSYIDPAGLEYRLNDDTHALIPLNGLQGFGVPKITTQSEQRPYRDGALLVGRPYTAPRELSVSLILRHNSVAELMAFWRQLARNTSAYKDVTNLGALRVVRPDGAIRQIDCWMVECLEPQEIGGPAVQATELQFWAPNPWFYDPTERQEAFLLDSPGGVSYPIEYEVTYTSADIDTYIAPLNAGDVDAWARLQIAGPGQSPKIVNETTGKVFELPDAAMDAGDYITIDMDAATVEMYDAGTDTVFNIIEMLSDASEFWPLRRGQNRLHVTMANSGSGSVAATWRNYYQSGV